MLSAFRTLVVSIFLMASSLLLAQGASTNPSNNESVVQLKSKVAIARFTNETQSGQSFLLDDSGDRIGKQASDILSARLAATGKFLMFERADVDKMSAEQILAGLKESGVAVDYLILGSVSEFGRSTESESGLFSRSKKQSAYAKVNVRLVDVMTGRIIHSTEGAGTADSTTKKTLGAGSSAGYDQSLTDKAISAAISQLISHLVETMSGKPWRSYFLAKEEGGFLISGGASQGLHPEIELAVYSRGKKIKNPQTGAMIELPGKKIAKIKVVNSFGEDEFNELSFVTVIDGSISSNLDEYYIQQH